MPLFKKADQGGWQASNDGFIKVYGLNEGHITLEEDW